MKRKREDVQVTGDSVHKPPPGTRSFATGKAVKQALALGNRQSFVSFHQQILTAPSLLPLPITHPTVVILQHYLDASPTLDEIFECWSYADKTRNDKLLDNAVSLLIHIITILAPLPFFRASLVGIVRKIQDDQGGFHILINKLVQSGKREQVLLGLHLAASAVQLDRPDPAAASHGASGRLAQRMWAVLVEGGSVKGLGKLMGMRRRGRDGVAEYGDKDPLDRPDVRHALLQIILPLLTAPAFHAHARQILPGLYSNLSSDPPITVLRVLNSLWTAMTAPTPGIARRIALILLDERALESLLGLLTREDTEASTGRAVGDIVGAFLEGVTCTPGRGLCFQDEGWYPRDAEAGDKGSRDERERRGLHNRILANVARKIGAKVADETRMGEWAVKLFDACPELLAGYWAHSALSLEPRLAARWIATMSYIGRIISLPPPPLSTFRLPVPRGARIDADEMPPRTEPPSVATMIEAVLPAPLTRSHVTKGLSHPDHLVQYMTAMTLARGLQKLGVVQGVLLHIERELDVEPGPSTNVWARRRSELEMEARKRVPEVLVIIGYAQRSATLSRTLPDSDDEPDPALLSRSQMLTESALRLFGLYHRTLPSIANEAKFDVGKLLVSASSARAERRERREAREGSVISDSGSVGSIGTVGTAGMGGGFGHARGEVQGFEALAQVHVLSLLGAVRDWQWSNKAAGSQYTYLYHILLLHLNTPFPKTREMTTALLDRLLQPSILFEHDPEELTIWLSALPRLENGDLESRARLLMQQIHLLSFLDDCVRRCLKTPYRYIEEGMSLVPDYFTTTKTWEMISPIMVTMLEQLKAKILGELIATEAASVVLRFLGRVMLGLAGKMKDGVFLEAIIGRLEGTLQEATGKGQTRAGLSSILNHIQGEMKTIFMGSITGSPERTTAHELVDQEEWTARNFPPAVLDLAEHSDSIEVAEQLEKQFITTASGPAIARYGRLVLHLLCSRQGGSLRGLFTMLQRCLIRATGVPGRRFKDAVFTSGLMVLVLTSRGGDSYRSTLNEIVGTLREDDEDDVALAEGYTRRLVHLLAQPRLDLTLRWFLPWTRFFTPEQAKEAVSSIVPRIRELADVTREIIDNTLGQLVVRTDDPAFALSHLKSLVKLGATDSVTRLIDSQASQRTTAYPLRDLDVSEKTMKRLLTDNTLAATRLVTKLVSTSIKASKAFTANLNDVPELLQRADLLLGISLVVGLPGAFGVDVEQRLLNTASAALAQHPEAAINVLVSLSGRHSTIFGNTISGIAVVDFAPAHSQLALALASSSGSGMDKALEHLFTLGLQWAVRACSSDTAFSSADTEVLESLTQALRVSDGVELQGHLVEPVIISVASDRLDVPAAVEFAIVVSEKTVLKASFVRQTIQHLFDSKQYKSLSTPASSARSHRHGFVHLLCNIFHASPYASCQPNLIEPLLPLYDATLAPADQRLLAVFKLFEDNRHVSVVSIFKAWSPNGPIRGQRGFDCLISLDARQVFATCTRFPLRRGLGGNVKEITEIKESKESKETGETREHKENKETKGQEPGEQLYDPAFVLMLFALTLSEPLTGLDWVEVLRTNALGMAVCALASRDAGMRGLGAHCLAKSLALVSATPFQERPTVLHILRLIRHAIPASPEMAKVPRLPTLTTLFLAHAFRSISTPGHFLYPLISRFLLQRPTLDLHDVPMLYSMLYASEEGYKRERAWIVRLLQDGVRSEADWRILKRRQTWSLLATIYGSVRDQSYRRLIAQAMESMTRIPAACPSLVHRDTMLLWLTMKWDQAVARASLGAEDELKSYLGILENIVVNMVHLERPKEWRRSRRWDGEVTGLVRRAVEGADAERLLVLSRITLRMARLTKCDTLETTLPLIVSRLLELEKEGMARETLDAIVEHLFQASLGLGLQSDGEVKGDLRGAVDEIGWRAGKLDSAVGEWVRSERRLAEWALVA